MWFLEVYILIDIILSIIINDVVKFVDDKS